MTRAIQAGLGATPPEDGRGRSPPGSARGASVGAAPRLAPGRAPNRAVAPAPARPPGTSRGGVLVLVVSLAACTPGDTLPPAATVPSAAASLCAPGAAPLGVSGAAAPPPAAPPARVSSDTSWRVHPWRDRFDFVQAFPTAGEGAWFTLHTAASDMDGEVGLRPYVWRTTTGSAGGDGWEDLWRGSSLARPIVAARLFQPGGAWGDEQLLCVLHRADSFLAPDPATRARVHRVYRWNGFGFRAVADAAAMEACTAM